MSTTAVQPVIFEEKESSNGKIIAFATLNSPKSLNALSLEMIHLLADHLEKWRNNDQIACIILQGTGEKAFCAGGDIKLLHESMQEFPNQENPKANEFFQAEYTLDHTIHTYPKPILCWGNGIVMGGGMGLMAGSSHRVVTEGSRLAMPEITIGLYPEVGGSWFLNRMPGRSGLYLGLTASHLNAADALFVDLADFYVPNDQLDAVLTELTKAHWTDSDQGNHTTLSTVLRKFTSPELPAPSNVREHFDYIQRVTDHDNVIDIFKAIEQENPEEKWLSRGFQTLKNGSPTSAHVIFKIYSTVKHLSLKEVFKLEFELSSQFVQRPDLAEGIRALLIDKDNNPNWSPKTLEEVSEEWVDGHFKSPWTAENHPLKNI